eukprot:361335-Chlamydomonas_euryale.AAC.15
MDQTGSARSYPMSTSARCRRERKEQGPEKGRKKGNRTKGKQDERGREGRKQDPRKVEGKPGWTGKTWGGNLVVKGPAPRPTLLIIGCDGEPVKELELQGADSRRV